MIGFITIDFGGGNDGRCGGERDGRERERKGIKGRKEGDDEEEGRREGGLS